SQGQCVCRYAPPLRKMYRYRGRRLAGLESPRALHVGGEVSVSQLEPCRPAQPRNRLHEAPCLVAAAPSGLRIGEVRERIEGGVDIRRDCEPQMLEIVGGVDHYAQPPAEEACQPKRELGAANATRERDVGSPRAVAHRNKSCALGRSSAEAGRAAAVHARPRTSAAGRASAASPMASTAADATASAK